MAGLRSSDDRGPVSVSALAAEPALLEIRDLVVHFPLRRHEVARAVDGVSFDLGVGDTLGIVGETGSGKSTVGLTVLHQYRATAGRIVFDGRDITDVAPGDLRVLRREMQMVFQDPYSSLNPRMKVSELVAEPLLVHGLARKGPELTRRTGQLLETCGLPASAMSRYPTAFSGGERQRIAIARALGLAPKLIVADEPTSALDVSIQAQIINLMLDLQERENVSYLFISHNLGVVRQIARRVAIMYAGKVMELGPSPEIFVSPLHPYTHALLSASPVADPRVQRGRRRIVLRGEIPSVVAPPQGCRFNTRCPIAAARCFTEEPPITEVAPRRWAACWRTDEARGLPGAAADECSTEQTRPGASLD
jgi:oligopeptide/dipeptide ABC transporter ATP-binding protein